MVGATPRLFIDKTIIGALVRVLVRNNFVKPTFPPEGCGDLWGGVQMGGGGVHWWYPRGMNVLQVLLLYILMYLREEEKYTVPTLV